MKLVAFLSILGLALFVWSMRKPELQDDSPCTDGTSQICMVLGTRITVDASKPPWSAIGRLVRADGDGNSHCTGTMIGAAEVLTAAHCLLNGGKWISPEKLRFEAGYHDGTALAASLVHSYRVGRRFDDPPGSTAANPKDWALLTLEEDPSDTVGTIPTLPRSKIKFGSQMYGNFVAAGYPRAASQELRVKFRCKITGVERSLANIEDCPLISGDSGGPLLYIDSFALFLVGINVAATNTGILGGGIAILADSIDR